MPPPSEFVVKDVFRIGGRGTAVVVDRPTEGEFLHGDIGVVDLTRVIGLD